MMEMTQVPQRRVLACGCVPGFLMCKTAKRLWREYEQAMPDSVSAIVALERFNKHIR